MRRKIIKRLLAVGISVVMAVGMPIGALAENNDYVVEEGNENRNYKNTNEQMDGFIENEEFIVIDELGIVGNGLEGNYGNVEINPKSFPDGILRDIVLTNYDMDDDNVLSEDEVENVATLDIPWNAGVKDLTGIRYFVNLTDLDFSYNKVVSLEELDYLRGLTSVSCFNNEIQSLQGIENLENLISLRCANNKIDDTRALEGLKNLKTLSCFNNPIAILDLKKNENLESVFAYNCNLGNIYVQNLKKLRLLVVRDNWLKSIDLTGCAAMNINLSANCIPYDELKVIEDKYVDKSNDYTNQYTVLGPQRYGIIEVDNNIINFSDLFLKAYAGEYGIDYDSVVVSAQGMTFSGQEFILNPFEGTEVDVSFQLNPANDSAPFGIVNGLNGEFKVHVIKKKSMDVVDINNTNIGIVSSTEYTGKEIRPSVSVQYGTTILNEGADYNISYYNNIDIGTASVIIQGINNYTGSKTVYFEITSPKKNISEAVVNEIPDTKYTGSPITPKVIVKYQGVELKEEQDYTLTYTDNVEMGFATVKISGINDYKGEKTVHFQIAGENDIANAEISDVEDVEYTGNEIKPKITVKYNGIVLTNGQDYTLSYENNVKVGMAYIIIKGINKYAGENIVGFNIKKPSVAQPNISSISIVSSKYIKLNWKAVTGAKGYRLYRKSNGSSWKEIKTLSGTTYTDKSVKFGTKYVYTIKAYKTVDGKTYWSTYNKTGKSATVTYVAPTLSSAKATGYNAVKLTWKKVSGVSGYRVYRKTSANGSYKAIATLGNVSTYTDKKAAGGTTYIYTVRGYKKSGSKYTWGNYNSSGIKIKSKMQPRKVSLKPGATYTKYDITGDGKNDKIYCKRLTNGVQIYVNGKNAGQIKSAKPADDLGINAVLTLATIDSKNIYLVAEIKLGGGMESTEFCKIYKCTGGKLSTVATPSSLNKRSMYTYLQSVSGESIILNQSVRQKEVEIYGGGSVIYQMEYVLKNGKLTLKSRTMPFLGVGLSRPSANTGSDAWYFALNSFSLKKSINSSTTTYKAYYGDYFHILAYYVNGNTCGIKLRSEDGSVGWLKLSSKTWADSGYNKIKSLLTSE